MTENRPFVLGLTGSIGMGKSTTAGFFRARGLPVWDADAAVHRLYGAGGAAVAPIAALCPGAIDENGVSRPRLRDWIARDACAMTRLEQIVHPLVAKDRADFIAAVGRENEPLVVVDVPLLFETGAEAMVDAVLVVTAPPEVQKARVLAREGMTESHFNQILAKQMPDRQKRERADYIIETPTFEAAEQAVERVLADIKQRIDQNA